MWQKLPDANPCNTEKGDNKVKGNKYVNPCNKMTGNKLKRCRNIHARIMPP